MKCYHLGSVPVEESITGDIVARLCSDCTDQLPVHWTPTYAARRYESDIRSGRFNRTTAVEQYRAPAWVFHLGVFMVSLQRVLRTLFSETGLDIMLLGLKASVLLVFPLVMIFAGPEGAAAVGRGLATGLGVTVGSFTEALGK